MKPQGWLILASMLAACGTGGYSNADARAANAVAVASNETLPIVVEAYKTESLEAVDASATREEAEQRWSTIRAKWAPIWRAWETYRAAFAVWSSALSHNQPDTASAAVTRMHEAFCAFRSALPGPVSGALFTRAPSLQAIAPGCTP